MKSEYVASLWSALTFLIFTSYQLHLIPRVCPPALKTILQKSAFKIGRRVHGDLTRLIKNFDNPLNVKKSTVLDLKTISDARDLLPSSCSSSLAEMSAAILGIYLPKDDAIRRHNHWENPKLREAYQRYAAGDVWTSYQLATTMLTKYETVAMPDKHTEPGTAVDLHIPSSDGTQICARGTVSHDQPTRLQYSYVADNQTHKGSINVAYNPNRLAVNVTSVLLPAARLPLYLPPTSVPGTRKGRAGRASPLSFFGSAPFTVAFHIKDLRFTPPADTELSSTQFDDEALETRASQMRERAAVRDQDIRDGSGDMENSDQPENSVEATGFAPAPREDEEALQDEDRTRLAFENCKP